jgi:hypothetical protein
MSECRRCGRALRDPVSLSRGVGPVCWRRAHPAVSRPCVVRSRRRADSAEQLALMFAVPAAPIEDDPLDIPAFLRRSPA